MKLPSRFILPTCALLLAGCTTPPLAPPDALDDYRAAGVFKDKTTKHGQEVDSKECILNNPANSNSTALDRALDKVLIRSCQYAQYHDAAKNFKAGADQSTLGLATVTTVGALTDSSSTFIKSAAGLTGLTAGLRIYTNPDIQMTTYIKAANATQCLATSIKKLKDSIPSGAITATNLTEVRNKAIRYSTALSQLKFNPQLQQTILSTAPGPEAVEIISLATTPDSDLKSKEQAINFITDIESLTDQNLRTIYGKIVATLNAQAFNVDSATKPISDIKPRSTNPEEALTQSVSKLEAMGFVAQEDATPEQIQAAKDRQFSAAALNSIKTLMADDSAIPYDEIIRINNEYTSCMTTFSTN